MSVFTMLHSKICVFGEVHTLIKHHELRFDPLTFTRSLVLSIDVFLHFSGVSGLRYNGS